MWHRSSFSWQTAKSYHLEQPRSCQVNRFQLELGLEGNFLGGWTSVTDGLGCWQNGGCGGWGWALSWPFFFGMLWKSAPDGTAVNTNDGGFMEHKYLRCSLSFRGSCHCHSAERYLVVFFLGGLLQFIGKTTEGWLPEGPKWIKSVQNHS